ncbi:MAG: NADH-quinone oxidoreductase subunit [Verrucomicrobiota bacterium]|nr:NADH-quinone oxidoreductase subunit [Verrucomicrobiota bacterium]
MSLLSWIIFAPWIGALLVFLLRCKLSPRLARVLPVVFSLSTLALGLVALSRFDPALTGLQFVEKQPWIRALNVRYHVGLDGLSLVLVLLTGLLAPLALFGTTRAVRCPAIHGALFLILQGSALGVFLALDFFPWFIFWELSLVPAFFLIKLWGGPGASRAAYQFVIYTIGGSAFMLLGFAALYAATGTFDFIELAALGRAGLIAEKLAVIGGLWPQAVFLGVLLGLAVKVPLFPFHAWLPPVYAEAPTGTSMFLTGVMSKMGVYGFLRILWPIFPQPLQAAATPLLWLALAGVVLSAFAAMRQTDLKRMVAYSSINHLSYCLLSLFAVNSCGSELARDASVAALSGTILQMFNHGLSAAALFFCVGVLEDRSGGKRGLLDFGGVRSAAPVFAGFCGIALFSSLGLPGLNGFVGEFLIFRGVFGLAPWAAASATLGLLATALFLLTFWQRVFHGPASDAGMNFRDLDFTEKATLLPLLVLMFLLGVWPQLLAGLINPLVLSWTATLP